MSRDERKGVFGSWEETVSGYALNAHASKTLFSIKGLYQEWSCNQCSHVPR